MFVKKTALPAIIADALRFQARIRGDRVYYADRATLHRWAINEIKHSKTLSDYRETLKKNGCRYKGCNTATYVKIHVAFLEEIARVYPDLEEQAAIEIREAITRYSN